MNRAALRCRRPFPHGTLDEQDRFYGALLLDLYYRFSRLLIDAQRARAWPIVRYAQAQCSSIQLCLEDYPQIVPGVLPDDVTADRERPLVEAGL